MSPDEEAAREAAFTAEIERRQRELYTLKSEVAYAILDQKDAPTPEHAERVETLKKQSTAADRELQALKIERSLFVAHVRRDQAEQAIAQTEQRISAPEVNDALASLDQLIAYAEASVSFESIQEAFRSAPRKDKAFALARLQAAKSIASDEVDRLEVIAGEDEDPGKAAVRFERDSARALLDMLRKLDLEISVGFR